nr:MAG TPA: hypothetical protein [Caudoviricetes sp.]
MVNTFSVPHSYFNRRFPIKKSRIYINIKRYPLCYTINHCLRKTFRKRAFLNF